MIYPLSKAKRIINILNLSFIELGAIITRRNRIIIVNDGDSRIRASNVSERLQKLLGFKYKVATIAKNGQKVQEMVEGENIESLAAPLFNPHSPANIWIQSGGVNDFGSHRSVADFTADYIKLCRQARAKGFKVIACTIAPYEGDGMANILKFNEWLRANPDELADVICDLAAHLPTNSKYYFDGLHWTAAGGTTAAGLIYEAVGKVVI